MKCVLKCAAKLVVTGGNVTECFLGGNATDTTCNLVNASRYILSIKKLGLVGLYISYQVFKVLTIYCSISFIFPLFISDNGVLQKNFSQYQASKLNNNYNIDKVPNTVSDDSGTEYLSEFYRIFTSFYIFIHDLLKSFCLSLSGRNSFCLCFPVTVITFLCIFVFPLGSCSEVQLPVDVLPRTPTLEDEPPEVSLCKLLSVDSDSEKQEEEADIEDPQNSVTFIQHTCIAKTLKVMLLGRKKMCQSYSNTANRNNNAGSIAMAKLDRKTTSRFIQSDRNSWMYGNTSLQCDPEPVQPAVWDRSTSTWLDLFLSKPQPVLHDAWDFISEVFSTLNPMDSLLRLRVSTFLNPFLLLTNVCCLLYFIRHPVIHAFNVNGPVAAVQQDTNSSVVVGNSFSTFPAAYKNRCVSSNFFVPLGHLTLQISDTLHNAPIQCTDTWNTTKSIPVLPDFLMLFRDNEGMPESSELVLPNAATLPVEMHPQSSHIRMDFYSEEDGRVCSCGEEQLDEGYEVVYSHPTILKGFSSNRKYHFLD